MTTSTPEASYIHFITRSLLRQVGAAEGGLAEGSQPVGTAEDQMAQMAQEQMAPRQMAPGPSREALKEILAAEKGDPISRSHPHLTPYTLHLAPYTLHPTLYS